MISWKLLVGSFYVLSSNSEKLKNAEFGSRLQWTADAIDTFWRIWTRIHICAFHAFHSLFSSRICRAGDQIGTLQTHFCPTLFVKTISQKLAKWLPAPCLWKRHVFCFDFWHCQKSTHGALSGQENDNSVSRISKWHFYVKKHFPRPPQTRNPYFLNQNEKTLLLMYTSSRTMTYKYVFQIKKFQ